jgi:hypothetical protein
MTPFEEITFEYTTEVTNSYHWKAVINSEGLHFHDLSGKYQQGRKIYTQSLRDFWLYGNLMPLPDLAFRTTFVNQLKPLFEPDPLKEGPDPLKEGTEGTHFKLFKYPAPANPTLMWEIGDHNASDFVVVRPYGIDYGAQNWHDGLVYLCFLSFENFLHRPDFENRIFTPEIKQGIADYLATI